MKVEKSVVEDRQDFQRLPPTYNIIDPLRVFKTYPAQVKYIVLDMLLR